MHYWKTGRDQMKSLSIKLGVILVGFLIFGYACPVANAGDTWVLWEHSFYKSPRWELIGTYPNYQQCQERANRFREVAPGSDGYKRIMGNPTSPDFILVAPDGKKYIKIKIEDTEYTVLAPNKAIMDTKEGYVVIEWNCFPDTIDPRK